MYITEKKLLKWALYCNTIYVLLSIFVRPQGISISKIGITLLLVTSAIFIILLACRSIKKIKQIPKLLRQVFYLLIFWGIITIIRGLSVSAQDLVTNFGNVYMGWAWLLPMALVLGLKIENWSVVFKVIHVTFQLIIIVFLVSLLFDNSYLQWAWLLRPVNLLLLLGLYRYSLINKIQIFVIIAIYITVAIWVKQRMDILFLATTLFFLLIDKSFSVKIKRVFIKYIIMGFVFIFIMIFTVGYEYVSNMIASYVEFQDSRTFLFKEFMDDLSFKDKVFGRGSLGTYFSQFFENTRRYYEEILKVKWDSEASTRITVEVGYLQMILKGGFILLILNFIFYISASYLAIFRSRSKFIKGLGFYILIITILSMVSMRPIFVPKFIILWMAIGTVLNKKFRQMNDTEIATLVKFK